MRFVVGQVVVGNRRAIEHPAPMQIERGEWVVLQAELNNLVLVEARHLLDMRGRKVRLIAKAHLLCTPEERVAEELMA